MGHFVPILILGALISHVSAADDFPAGIEVRDYTGWHQSIYINATETAVQAVIVPAVGGRLVHFSLDGENILYENSATQGRTMTGAQENLWLGGYQCDVGTVKNSAPPDLQLSQGSNEWKLKGDFAVHVSSGTNSGLGLEVEKDFLISPDTGELGLMQRMRNISDKEVSAYLRDRTLCKGGGFVFFPLNNKSRFKAGWSQRRQTEGKEESEFDGEHLSAFQARVLDGMLVISATGGVTQIGADSTAGWMAYARGNTLLVKYFPWFAKGAYPDGGNTVEVYFDQRAVELSPLSPETKLAPGQNFSLPEKWLLITLPKEVTTWEEARKLVRKIPPSPFGY